MKHASLIPKEISDRFPQRIKNSVMSHHQTGNGLDNPKDEQVSENINPVAFDGEKYIANDHHPELQQAYQENRNREWPQIMFFGQQVKAKQSQ